MSILDHSRSVCPNYLLFNHHTLGFAQKGGEEGKRKKEGRKGETHTLSEVVQSFKIQSSIVLFITH